MAEDKELRYDPTTIEPKWQKRWAADPGLYATDSAESGKPKYYVLEMLPYPDRSAPHGTRPQLRHWRRPCPPYVDAWL